MKSFDWRSIKYHVTLPAYGDGWSASPSSGVVVWVELLAQLLPGGPVESAAPSATHQREVSIVPKGRRRDEGMRKRGVGIRERRVWGGGV